jgi:coenzyme PQQ precursor peptide PqqA
MCRAKPPFALKSRERTMAWKKPRVTEVCLGLEINSYASATVA